jgi:hypothetical protein
MDKKTKELYENSMINDIIENYLEEGINDTAIFKAVFLAGGPGSGKSFIGTEKKGKSPTVGADPKQFMGGGQLGLINLGLRVVNPDPAYEKLLKAAGLDPKSSDDIWSDEGQDIRVKASAMTAKQKAHYVNERLGIIIDGTGKDVNKIIGQKKLLDDAGYETAMIYVNTNLETAIARDAKRDRTLGANAVTKMWDAVQKNVKKYKSIFGSSMYIIDNSDGSNWLGESQKAHKKIEKWVRKSPSSPKAKAWIANKDRMRNEPKGGIREEDSHYLPGYTTGFYGYDPETSRSKIQDLHHDIRRSSSINDACNEVSEKWHTKLAELSKLNATHLDDLDDEDIEKLLPIAIKMRKEQMSLEEGFLDTFLGRNMKRQNEELDESVYDKKLTQAWKKLLSVPNVRGISNSGQNHAKKLSSLLKGSPDNLTFEKLELALGTYETHAYKAAEDKKNPHGKEDLAKLEEFSNSVDDVIGAMKNLHQSQLPEGFLDTFLGRNMKKGNVDKKKSKKSKNSEQVKLSTEIDRKLRLIDDLMKKVRPLGGNLGRLMAFRKLPIDKMTPKGMYVALNDWWDSVEADLDDDSEDDNEKYAQSAEKLYDLWEEVGFKLSDYMWASGYNVKGIGQMAKIGFPAKKRTDPEWLKMNESVELDEKAPKIDPKKYAAHMDRNKKKKTISSTKKNLSDISKRADKMSRESVGLNELSPKTKKSYKNKATRSIGNEKKYSDSYSDASKADPDNPTYKSRADQHKRKLKNRISGVAKADESALDELSMTKADLTKTGMRVDSKKMAELKKELMKLKKGLKVKMEQYIAESVYFEDETMEMVARDLMIMQNKILDLVEIMDDNGMGGVDSQPISLEPWVVAKITKAKDYLDSIHDYTVMDNENE